MPQGSTPSGCPALSPTTHCGRIGLRWRSSTGHGFFSPDAEERFASFLHFPVRQRENAPGMLARRYADFLQATRPLLYVLDEPERHLHPRLQREAAAWLDETATDRACVSVATTRSRFRQSLPNACLSFTWRSGGGRSQIDSIRRDQLTALDIVSSQLGLDRGN